MSRLLPVAVVVPLLAALAPAQPPKAEEKHKALDAAIRAATDAAEKGERDAATAAARQAVALEAEVSGKDAESVRDREAWAAAVSELATAVGKHTRTDWRAVTPRLAVRDIDRSARFSADERKRLARMTARSEEGDRLAEAGRFAEAVVKIREAADDAAALFGGDHPRVAFLLLDQGWIYYQTRAFAKAEPLLEKAAALTRAAYGAAHPTTAHVVNPLAILYRNTGRVKEALRLYEGVAATLRETTGKSTPEYATVLSNLANVYSDLERYDDARDAAAESVALRRAMKAAPDDLAVSLNNLAMVYRDRKEYARAEPLFREAVKLNETGLRATHPDYAHALHNLAANLFDAGDAKAAGPLFRRALGVILDHQEVSAAVQSEADQLSAGRRLRFYLNSLLAGCGRDDPAAVYELVYRARGAVTLRQRYVRADAARDPAARDLVAGVREASRRMAALAVDPAPDARRRYDAAAAEREKLESALAEKVAAFRTTKSRRADTLAAFQKQLPADAVLVDYLFHHDRVTAFVVTAGGVTRFDLGRAAAVATAVAEFRAELLRGGSGATAGAVLRRALWVPLAEPLARATHILVCPDGPVCGLPFAALPGAGPKTYLIEDVSLSVLPVPQLLPELLADKPADPAKLSLLAVGDVDFGTGRKWSPLPGTKAELDALLAAHGRVAPGVLRTELRGAAATEAAAVAAMPKHGVLHLATHGYFLPPPPPTAVPVGPQRRLGDVFRDPMTDTDTNPGARAGVVLAGANAAKQSGEGLLTALEVADLDLTAAALVTLSACETGLGQEAGGEGMLGLQRAFQVAGARTVVSSLWKVPDIATQRLMTRFYANLWTRKMPTLAALREAQLWLLRDGGKDADLRRGATADDDGKPLDPPPDGRLPPRAWAAFTLSGDWR